MGRLRRYSEGPDVISAGRWKTLHEPAFWVGADKLDPPYPGLNVDQPQLYNLDVVAYESLFIGLFSIFKGPPNNERVDRNKRNEVYVGYSRDGFHWTRPLRQPFIGVSGDSRDWNYGNVQSAGGGCLVIEDKLYFYYSGRTGYDRIKKTSGTSSTGLAILRRDGFVSMDAGESGGTLNTRPVRFSGKHLFVNVDTHTGELRVEILDKNNRVIPPFSRENSIPVRIDKTIHEIGWKGVHNLSSVSGKDVRFRFHLRNGSLYSYWVGPDKSGASHGYVAAGGFGFTGHADTEGINAYR
jgi:hypothetical protein